MSREYAEKRIREALQHSKGNPTRARQQIIAWAADDPKLLLALARPHLTGIVAHAVSRVIDRPEEDMDVPEDRPADPAGIDMTPEGFGKEILQILSNQNTTVFGQESSAPPSRRKPASQRHIDALRQIAKKKD